MYDNGSSAGTCIENSVATQTSQLHGYNNNHYYCGQQQLSQRAVNISSTSPSLGTGNPVCQMSQFYCSAQVFAQRGVHCQCGALKCLQGGSGFRAETSWLIKCYFPPQPKIS